MPKIVSVVIHHYPGFEKAAEWKAQGFSGSQDVVMGTFEDGSSNIVLSYYGDELSFEEKEFVGLDKEGVNALFFKKDQAYLRS